jgi:hypothetical protein
MKTIIESQYLPPIAYFSVLLKQPTILIEQHENYQKRSYRNRCHIATANGILRLSIPLEKGKNNQMTIKDVKVYNADNWQLQHWRAIKSAYGKSPYFEFYADELLPYFEKKYDFLLDWNMDLLQFIVDVLNLPVDIQLTDSYYSTNEAILDYRNNITPKMPTNTTFQGVYYGQVFEDKHGFIPNLSILDLLFCKGPEAILLLDKLKHHL